MDQTVNLLAYSHMVAVLEEQVLTVLAKTELQVDQVVAVVGVIIHTDMVDPV
jgi:hypothetical protein